MRRILMLFFMFSLCTALFLIGCSEEKVIMEPTTSSPEQSPVPMIILIDEQKDAMKAFLIEHQEGMEELVAVMMEYSVYSSENDYTTFSYDVRHRNLVQYHHTWKGSGFPRKGETDYDTFSVHPIIAKASILDDELIFQYVSTDFSRFIVDNDICSFETFIHTGEGIQKKYSVVYLFYCEEEPVINMYTGAYFSGIEPVIPHWFFFVEDLE